MLWSWVTLRNALFPPFRPWCHHHTEAGKEAVEFRGHLAQLRTGRHSQNRPSLWWSLRPAAGITVWQGCLLGHVEVGVGPEWDRRPSTNIGIKLVGFEERSKSNWNIVFWSSFPFNQPIHYPWSSEHLQRVWGKEEWKKGKERGWEKDETEEGRVDRSLGIINPVPERSLGFLLRLHAFCLKNGNSIFIRSKFKQSNVRTVLFWIWT